MWSQAEDLGVKSYINSQFNLSLAHLVVTVLMLLLNAFADKITDEKFLSSKKPCPNYEASFLNKLYYIWVFPLMWRGYRNPLTMTDLWDIRSSIVNCCNYRKVG